MIFAVQMFGQFQDLTLELSIKAFKHLSLSGVPTSKTCHCLYLLVGTYVQIFQGLLNVGTYLCVSNSDKFRCISSVRMYYLCYNFNSEYPHLALESTQAGTRIHWELD